jgi:hypothetical protein
MPVASFPRLTDKAKPLITQALKAEAPGEKITWDVSVVAFPDPSAGTLLDEDDADPSEVNAFVPVLLLYLEIPMGETKETVYTSTILAPYAVNKSNVDYAVRGAVKTILTRRDQLLAELTKDLTEAES